jgi:ferrous iron transport protein B
MIFFSFAMQCTSTIAVVHRETNSWKWPVAQFLYMLVLAYGAAFAVNHIVMALG